ncbi:MAG: hypothetical protein KC483_02515 [Nitrosarchaeum sp.]|nr:hypothetical protein [Nitrosarchaeum sp.]
MPRTKNPVKNWMREKYKEYLKSGKWELLIDIPVEAQEVLLEQFGDYQSKSKAKDKDAD